MRRRKAGVCALGTLGLVGTLACGDDGSSRPSTQDAGVEDAGVDARATPDLDAKADAQPELDSAQRSDASELRLDAQADTSVDANARSASDAQLDLAPDAQTDASSSCPLPGGKLTYYFDSGYARYLTVYSVTGAGVFRRERNDLSMPDAGIDSCVAALPACGSNLVDGADLGAALAAADVAAAFSTDESLVLGLDTRASDGAVLVVERADGKRITIGYRCDVAGPVCSLIPPGVQSLADVLFQLSSQQASAGPCFSLMI